MTNRKNFDDITVFVPHIAASGGTLIALVGNEIVMGDMSTLTPIDVQMERNGKMYSVNAMIRSFSALNDLFKDTAEEEYKKLWEASRLWVKKYKKYLTEDDIRKIFTDPNSLRKGIELWKTAEKRGQTFIRKIKNERKKSLERTSS
ncbi:MAG: SDH family Clp fold serine proteinase [Candidatus Methanospirareceae archaeon]